MSAFREAVEALFDHFERQLSRELAAARAHHDRVPPEVVDKILESHAVRYETVFDWMIEHVARKDAEAAELMRAEFAPLRAMLEKRVGDLSCPH